VVLAASYEARAFGVRAGMPGWRAQRLCPGLRFVGGHFQEYQRLGDAVIEVCRDFTPLVERISIDEAFLDVAGAIHLFGAPAKIAADIRRRVGTEIGLPISIGVAATKHLAKIASQVAKPDGLVVVEPDGEAAFLRPLPVELMWGVGPATQARLAAMGIRTIGELAATGDPVLRGLLGEAAGAKLGSLAVNADPRAVAGERRAKSVGAQSALGRRPVTARLLRSTLGYLADRVAGRLRAAGCAGRTITVRVRFTGMRSVSRAVTLPDGIATTLTLTELATDLAVAVMVEHPDEREITLLAISVSKLVAQPGLQLELPVGARHEVRPGSRAGAARWAVDRSVDTIRAQFGRDAVGYATVVFSGEGRVPVAFRELAEHHELGGT
jgi:DNA polymerase-4